MVDAAPSWSIPARSHTVAAEGPATYVQPSAPSRSEALSDFNRPLGAGLRHQVSIKPPASLAGSAAPCSPHLPPRSPGLPSLADRMPAVEQMTLNDPLPVTPRRTVPISKRSSWSRSVAFEACLRVCLRSLVRPGQDQQSAGLFLQHDYQKLSTAFALTDMFLKEPSHGHLGDELDVLWEEPEDESASVAPTMIPVTSSAACKVTPLRLISQQAAQAVTASAPKHSRRPSWMSTTTAGSTSTTDLYIHMQHAAETNGQGVWTVIGPSLTAHQSVPLDMSSYQQGEDVIVAVHGPGGEKLAQGTMNTTYLWKVANKGPEFDDRDGSQFNMWKQLFGCGKAFENARSANARLTTTMVDLTNVKDGNRYGQVQLGVWMTNPETAPMQESSKPISIATKGRNILTITSWQVYDLVLTAALAGDGCGPRRLSVEGEWRWLLDQIAATYGIKQTYQKLAHLNWVMGADVYSQTAPCLQLVVDELSVLKQSADSGSMLPREELMYKDLLKRAETAMAQVFECYFTLGMLGNPSLTPSQAGEAQEAVLRPAIALFQLIKSVNNVADQSWLADRFVVGARRQYNKLQFNAEQEHGNMQATDAGGTPGHHRRGNTASHLHGYDATGAPAMPSAGAEAAASVSYRVIRSLCFKIQGELDQDRRLQTRGILPAFINFPAVTASEYCRELNSRLHADLQRFPPTTPSSEAIDLLVAVGELQRYLDSHALSHGWHRPAVIDANRIFGAYVKDWFAKSRDMLLSALRSQANVQYMATNQKALANQKPVSPIVNSMQKRIQQEAERYERVVSHWPVFGPQLESIMSAALRETIQAVCKHCGFVQAAKRGALADSPRYHPSSQQHSPGPQAYQGYVFDMGLGAGMRAQGPGGAARGPGLSLQQTMLLNSLCELLTFIPRMDQVMQCWIRASRLMQQGEEDDADLHDASFRDDQPAPGAQFAEVVVELRSKYGAAVAAAAEQLSSSVFSSQGMSPKQILLHLGLAAPAAKIIQHLQPMQGVFDQTLQTMSGQLEPRVFVSCTRGLWDFSSKEVFEYVQSLQQGKENRDAWRGKQNAASVINHFDQFFKQVINRVLGSSASPKDMDAPYHADKCHKLLADNTAQINLAFTPF